MWYDKGEFVEMIFIFFLIADCQEVLFKFTLFYMENHGY